MGGQTVTSEVGDPSKVVNINQDWTSQFWNQLQNMQGGFTEGMGQFSPTNNIASLQGVLPGMQNIANSLISPYGTNLMNTADIMGRTAMRGIGNQFSNAGALNTGAGLSAMTRGYAEPISNAVTNIAGMQSQLGGGLAQALLGQMGGAYNTQAGLLGNALNLQGQLAAPEWWQPTYMQQYQPGFMDYLLGGVGAAGGLATGIGGLSSLLGGGTQTGQAASQIAGGLRTAIG